MVELWRRFQHWRLRGDLSAYLDGQLSASPAHRLEAHLAACAQCRRELTELQAAVAALRQLPQAMVPRSFLLSPQQVRRPASASPRFSWPLPAVAVATAVALAVLLAVDLMPSPSSEREAPAALVSAATALPAAARQLGVPQPTAVPQQQAVAETITAESKAADEPAVAATPALGEGPSALRLVEIALGVGLALFVGMWVVVARRARP